MDHQFDVQTLELQSLIGFDGIPANGLILHPDGEHLVYPLGSNITAYNWNTKKQRFFEGHSNAITSLAVSKTGKYVAAGQVNFMGFRSPIIVWLFDTGEMYTKYESHNVRVESVSFSCCERYLISLGGLDDGSIMVYEVNDKETMCGSTSVKSTAGISSVVKSVHLRSECFVVAGENIMRLCTLDRDQRSIHSLDASFAKIKRNILCLEIDRMDEYAYCGTSTGDVLKVSLNFSADKAVLAPSKSPSLVGCYAKYPTATKKNGPLTNVELYSKGVTSLCLVENPSSTSSNKSLIEGTMIVGSGDGIVELVNEAQRAPGKKKPCAKEANRLATPTRPLFVALKSANVDASVTSLQLMRDVLLVGTSNCELFVIDMINFNPIRLFTCHTSIVYDLAFPQNYCKVFATASRNDVRVWSVDTLQELLRITVKNYTCSGVLFSYDGTQIVTSWNDGKIRAFTPETGRMLYTIINCHNNGVTAIGIAQDGKKLYSGGGDGQVRVWGVDNMHGDLLAVLKEHKGPVSSVNVRQSVNEAVTASTDGTCIVWDTVRYTRLSIMFSNTVFTSAKYHPNGTQVLTCGTNRFIGFWETHDGSLIREIEGSASSSLNSLDVSPTGKYFVTGSSDQMVKVWLYKEGVPTYVGIGHASVVTNVKVSPDGRFIVSTSADGSIYLWRFPHDDDLAPVSRCASMAGARTQCGNSREQQTDRARQLSQKKSMPARQENISTISNAQKVRSSSDGAAGGDGVQAAAAAGSVKCLCKPSTACKCGDNEDGGRGSRKSTRNGPATT